MAISEKYDVWPDCGTTNLTFQNRSVRITAKHDDTGISDTILGIKTSPDRFTRVNLNTILPQATPGRPLT